MSIRTFQFGERVLIIDSKKRRYLATLSEKGEFHSHSGVITHAQIVGLEEGALIANSKGSSYSILRPTLEDFVLEMPRGAQVIYPKDLAPICMIADIGPGMRVFETGVGSGALSMTMLRYGAHITGYELREDFANPHSQTFDRSLAKKALSVTTFTFAMRTRASMVRISIG